MKVIGLFLLLFILFLTSCTSYTEFLSCFIEICFPVFVVGIGIATVFYSNKNNKETLQQSYNMHRENLEKDIDHNKRSVTLIL